MSYELIDRCPAGGGVQVVRTSALHALKARMRINSSEASSFFDGCLYMRATVNHADGPVTLYLGDYYYSNGREHHAAD